MTRVLKPYRTERAPRAERAPSAQGMSEIATSARPAITSGHHRRDCCGSANGWITAAASSGDPGIERPVQAAHQPAHRRASSERSVRNRARTVKST